MRTKQVKGRIILPSQIVCSSSERQRPGFEVKLAVEGGVIAGDDRDGCDVGSVVYSV